MNQLTVECPITLTAGAVQEITRLSEQEGNKTLRIGVENGGCAGFSYIFKFDTATEKDEVFDLQDINIIIEKDHINYLSGTEIDFENGLNNRGFTYKNPNANTTCGCGTSFA